MSNKKTMKKSMVVTTVVMVLLLIAALSTATFAWYTAQSNASVTETLVTSANSTSASLVIDEAAATSKTANQSEVTITMNQAINPAMYNASAAPTAATTYGDFKAAFITYTVDNAGNYASAPTTTTVATISTVKGSSTSALTQDSFYVTNVGGVASGVEAAVTINANYYEKQTVTAGDSVEGLYTKDADGVYTATAAGATADGTSEYYALKANNFLRVAMFIGGKYVSTWALTGQTAVQYANIATSGDSAPKAGDPQATHSNYTATESGTAINVAATVAPMGNVQVQLVAWFEGDSHTNAYAGTGALFSVTFTGVAAA